MTESELSQLERRFEEAERDLKGRLETFERNVGTMTKAMEDIRNALLGDLRDSENLGLIASHRQLKADFANHRADVARWRKEDAEPILRDVAKFKIQVGVVATIIVGLWTIAVKVFWK